MAVLTSPVLATPPDEPNQGASVVVLQANMNPASVLVLTRPLLAAPAVNQLINTTYSYAV